MPPLTAYTSNKSDDDDASTEHDVNVAEPLNVKAPPKFKMAPPRCKKKREIPHKHQTETITHI